MLNMICDYIDCRVDAIIAAVDRGEWNDSMREELHALTCLLRKTLATLNP